MGTQIGHIGDERLGMDSDGFGVRTGKMGGGNGRHGLEGMLDFSGQP